MAAERPVASRLLHLTLAVLGAAVCATLWCIVALRPSSTGAYVFAVVWLALPHAAMAVLLYTLWRRGKPLGTWCIAALLIAAAGLYIIVDAIYLHPDPQGAIAVMLAPVFQGIAFLVASPLAWWASRRIAT